MGECCLSSFIKFDCSSHWYINCILHMKIVTMSKDQNGVFHPGKGKPSGANKEEGLGLQPTPPEKMQEYLEITDKYTIGEDELDPAVSVRHPNRNTSKGEETKTGENYNQ